MTGNNGQIQAYKRYLADSPYFRDIPDIDTKETQLDDHQFDKMIVRYRSEIVALGKTVTEAQVKMADRQISIEAFQHILEQKDEDWAILDMRNDYERQLGHFKGALPAGTINFREVPELLEKYKEKLQDKKVVMYCTGGIRCEKLSVLLKDAGFENFYALNGGVVKYIHAYNDGNRLGNLYTFDGRVSCPVGDTQTHVSIGRCIYTDEPTDVCKNCRYSPCNARIIVDSKAYRKHMGFCSQECAEQAMQDLLIKNADRDPVDYKSLRGTIKQDPTQKEAVFTRVRNYLCKKLLHREFRHQLSQKEKVLHEW
ncbi:MAG: rhodanese-like domain-containing protein [bacterium]|nr:rhodanese-like domain-containing protein [bacterium]